MCLPSVLLLPKIERTDYYVTTYRRRKGKIAKTVLMPGDPLRAQFIAENFLENAVRYSEIRNMYGYTGTYKGVPVSVQGSGMGMPSMGIYSWELFTEYNVENTVSYTHLTLPTNREV